MFLVNFEGCILFHAVFFGLKMFEDLFQCEENREDEAIVSEGGGVVSR